ncbi:tripartite motif-containing protein 14-like [Patagioenas fasciata monilis]|uniref:Tripartite motif-containing protein 14-like n=1 Tax=Patagioenas fasciata monilis TaxID=372326 RepID=A0A1V4K5K2_PATFA|nr:tripartite motif-containing protein 14-like [Patagioenas fasciata monilis]
MKLEKPRAPAPRARVCGVDAGRPLELFCEDCGRCVCALCLTLVPHCRHSVRLMTHAVSHNQGEMVAAVLVV